jgi:hypothetical protein
MDVVEIIQSQSVRFAQIQAPEAFFPAIAKEIQNRYEFVDAPRTAEDHTLGSNGVRFAMGHMGSTMIHSFRVYRDGIIAEGVTSTDNLDAFIEDVIAHIGAKFRLEITPGIVPTAYTTKLEVAPKGTLADCFDKLGGVISALNSATQSLGFKGTEYQVSGFELATEKVEGRPSAPRFLFERRAGLPLAANIFFSEAPLSSKAHIKLLQKLDSILL